MLKSKEINSNQNLLLPMVKLVVIDAEKEVYDATDIYDVISFSVLTAKKNIEKVVSSKDFKVETLLENEDLYANCILDAIEMISRTTEETVRNSMQSEYFSTLIVSYTKEILLRSTMHYLKDSFSLISSNEVKDAIRKLVSIKLDYMLDGLSLFVGFYNGINVRVELTNNLQMSSKYRKAIPLLYNPYNSDRCEPIKSAYANCIFKSEDAYFYIHTLENYTDSHDYLVSDFIIRRLFGYGIADILNTFCY